MSTALPRIQQELRGLALYGWVSAAYPLGQLIGFPPLAARRSPRAGAPVRSRPHSVRRRPRDRGRGAGDGGGGAGATAPGHRRGAIPAIAYVAAGRAYPPSCGRACSPSCPRRGCCRDDRPSISAAVTIQLGGLGLLSLLPLIPLAAAMTLPSLRRLSAGVDSATAHAGRLRRAILLAIGVALLLAFVDSALARDRRRRIGGAAPLRSYVALRRPAPFG